MKNRKILFIAGPTAVGKTDLALKLAKILNGEIVNADSMQIYRGMDIGTGKPSLQERTLVPHHMFDVVEPYEAFNVVAYQSMALNIIEEILKRGNLPIIVGGTGLYISALFYDVKFEAAPGDEFIRKRINKIIDEKGLDAIYKMLKQQDEHTTEYINKNNRIRIVRALELQEYKLLPNRESRAAWCKKVRSCIGKYSVEPLLFVLNYEQRELLYDKINRRVDMMMENGLLQEVESLCQKGLGPTAKQAIGYKEFLPLINGELVSYEEVVNIIKQNTRHYAKRQLTWFRKMKEANWISVEESMEKIIEQLQVKLK